MANLTNIGQKWLDVLIPFTNEYSASFTASELAKLTNIPRRTITRILSNLIRKNLIRYKIKGKNKEFHLDLDNPRTSLILKLIENFKALKFSKTKSFIFIAEFMQLNSVILFGSYAKGSHNKDSDIDLLILGNSSKKAKIIGERHLKEINLHFSTINDFKKSLKKKNILAIEIIKNHIIFGDSSFVDLCLKFYKR